MAMLPTNGNEEPANCFAAALAATLVAALPAALIARSLSAPSSIVMASSSSGKTVKRSDSRSAYSLAFSMLSSGTLSPAQ